MDEAQFRSVLEELGLPSGPDRPAVPRVISKSRIQALMQSDDVDVLGAIYSVIMDSERSRRIDPPLTFADYERFLLSYYTRCFKENPQSAWADSRYSAGWDFVNWFGVMWRDKTVPRSALAEFKQLLADLYREGDEELRTCIETATLEHLFEQKPIRNYFEDWKSDPVLLTAYNNAMGWTLAGGDSPLGKPPRSKKRKNR